MKTKTIDKLYQETLNRKVEQLFNKTVHELKDFDDFGQETVMVDNEKNEIGWCKYRINDQITYIVYKTSRRFLFFLHRPFLQGIKIENDKVEYLNDSELGDYD